MVNLASLKYIISHKYRQALLSRQNEVMKREDSAVHCGDEENTKKYFKLCLHNITKCFHLQHRKIIALEKVCLKVREGEFLCILGPSGCGKSTLLNLIAGLEHPDYGEIYSHCEPQTTSKALIVFQENALFPWLTVQQNVEFGLKMQGIPKKRREEIAHKHLQLVHLENFSRSYIHQLSGGMKQRVSLARALAMDPEILLMDEPFAALDVQTRRKLSQDVLEIWQKTKKTIIFVTHQLEEAISLGDRVVLFSANPGRIRKEFLINLPRPRQVEHPYFRELSQKISGEFFNTLPPERHSVVI